MLKQKNQDYPLLLNNKLNIAYINVCTEAEGPYKRMAIWFQGCDVLCKGCCNPELQEIKIAHIITVQEVIDIAITSKKENGIEGVTFLGGEPTMQKGLACLAKALSMENLGTILFTGKEYESLSKELTSSMDMIIDGKFEAELIDEDRNLIGSKNQQIIYITDRYKNCHDWFMSVRAKKVEMNFSDALFINGDVF